MLRLKELRKERRLNQEGLALKLNVSQSTVSAFESGYRVPDLGTLTAISDLFKVSLDYLAGLSDIKHPIKQPINQSDLSSDDLKYLLKYRQLDEIGRQKTQAYMDGLLDK